jgi:hypothetical protein
MELTQTYDGGWRPARGSYEEAVLSWQEQIERARERQQDDKLAAPDPQPRRGAATSTVSVAG